MFFTKRFYTSLLLVAVLVGVIGCAANPYKDLPVREATITESRQSLRKVLRPSVVNSAPVDGITNIQTPIAPTNERAKKLANDLGLFAGTDTAATGIVDVVPYSQVAFRDDTTGEEFRGALSGQWKTGMKLRYSVTSDNQVVVR